MQYTGGRVRAHVERDIKERGGVQPIFECTRVPALTEERHFALVDGVAPSNLGSLLIVAVRNSARPNHLFDHTRLHDY